MLGKKERPNVNMLWGSADSGAAEHNYRQKIQTEKDVPVEEVREQFASTFDEFVEQAGGDGEVRWEKSGGHATVKDRGVALAAAYHLTAAPRVQPIAVEERIEVSIPGVPIPVIGYPDVETAGTLIERKTSARKFTTPAGNYLAQARIYQLGIAKPKPVHWHVSTKPAPPAVYTPLEEPTLETAWSQHEMDVTARWVRSTAEAIAADMRQFGPDREWPGAMATRESPCSWCGFRDHGCPWWQS